MGGEVQTSEGSWVLILLEGENITLQVPIPFQVTYEANASSIVEKALV